MGTDPIFPQIQTPVLEAGAESRPQVRHDAYDERSEGVAHLCVAGEALRGIEVDYVSGKGNDNHDRCLAPLALVDHDQTYSIDRDGDERVVM